MACFTIRDLDDWTFESSKLLDDNKVVAAIKHCREQTGWSLREAKMRVEDLPAYAGYKARRDAS
jgi:ribosomal protein L7/L12